MALGAGQRRGILAFVLGTLLLCALLGPLRRTYLEPSQALAVENAAAFARRCEADGLHGRHLVVFARGLVPAENPYGDSPETTALMELMHHAVVRETFHVVPDAEWPITSRHLAAISIFRPLGAGMVAAFEDGRVNVFPRARFWPGREPALVLIDLASWDPQEAQAIAQLIASGGMRSDLIALLGGTATDVARWGALLKR